MLISRGANIYLILFRPRLTLCKINVAGIKSKSMMIACKVSIGSGYVPFSFQSYEGLEGIPEKRIMGKECR